MQSLKILFFLCTSFLFASNSPTTPECRRALKELNESKLLFALGEAEESKLEAWSSDLLARIIIELRGPYLSHCPLDEKMKGKVDLLEGLYLKKLGLSKVSQKERKLTFQGVLTLKEDFEKLQTKIAKEKIKVTEFKDLKKLYASVDEFQGVALVAEGEVAWADFKSFLNEICSKSVSPCSFTHSGTLLKILVTESRGVAAFLPEIAILVLSKELVQDLNPLHKLVVVHELSHVALVSAWNLYRRDFLEEFKDFSGWKKKGEKWTIQVRTEKREHDDALSTLSKDSPYSILPDAHWVSGIKKLDGFVFEKSHRESLERNDISEEFADSVAAYYVEPSRFCRNKKDFAPKKKNWIETHLFKGAKYSCLSN